MASGSDGHCPTQDRVNSSASQGGLDARICDVADTNPSLRSTSAECLAACAAGAVSGEPVHGGNAANTATTCAGWASAQLTATAAPMDTPPTTMAPSRAAFCSSETYPSISRSGCGAGATTTAPASCRAGANAR